MKLNFVSERNGGRSLQVTIKLYLRLAVEFKRERIVDP